MSPGLRMPMTTLPSLFVWGSFRPDPPAAADDPPDLADDDFGALFSLLAQLDTKRTAAARIPVPTPVLRDAWNICIPFEGTAPGGFAEIVPSAAGRCRADPFELGVADAFLGKCRSLVGGNEPGEPHPPHRAHLAGVDAAGTGGDG